MKITLKEYRSNDFKNLNKLEVTEFSDINNVIGTNKTGKTSFGNSIIWCLFGKDISGRTNYEIMPLDENNIVIPHQEPTVEILLDLDGTHKKFKRVLKQKWVKKRGEEKSNFDGSCETEYFIDDVPIKMKDYNYIVTDISRDDVFRTITLPSYFTSLEWKSKRDIITSIVPKVDESEISARDEFKTLFDRMEGKTISDYRKVINLQKKEYDKELKRIPEGIKATQNLIPEEAENWVQLARDIQEKEESILEIEKTITDKSKVLEKYTKSLSESKTKISELETKKSNFITEFTKKAKEKKASIQLEIDSLNQSLNSSNRKVTNTESDINDLESDIKRNINRIADLSDQRKANEKLYDDNQDKTYTAPKDNVCESCGQDITLSQDEIDKLEISFNQRKSNYLTKVVEDNAPLMIESKTLDTKNKEITKSIEVKKEEIKGFKSDRLVAEKHLVKKMESFNKIDISKENESAKTKTEYIYFDTEIKELTTQKDAPVVNVESENSAKSVLKEELKALENRLSQRINIENAQSQVDTYTKRGQELAQLIAELEGLEYASEKFENVVFDELENRINSKFSSSVQFKLFERQNNGGTKPACVILINGVPFEAANTAAQVSAGIEIINVLSEYHDIYAPIIIDCRESVVEIPEVKAQIFNLIVDKSVKKLQIN